MVALQDEDDIGSTGGENNGTSGTTAPYMVYTTTSKDLTHRTISKVKCFFSRELITSAASLLISIVCPRKCSGDRIIAFCEFATRKVYGVGACEVAHSGCSISFASSDLHQLLPSSPGKANLSMLSAFISTLYPGSVGVW